MKCPICHSEPNESFQAKYVTALKCGDRSCGHIYANRPSKGQGIQAHSDPDALFREYCDRNKDLIRFWDKLGFLKEGVRLLDIGSGSGHIIKSIAQAYKHVSITCIEPHPESSENLKRAGYDVVKELSDLDGKYDSVLLIEVLEHIIKPVELLSVLRAFIHNKGRIFLTTPCGELRNSSRSTNAYDNSAHIQFFTEQSLNRCILKAGYSSIDLMTINALKSKLNDQPIRYIKDVLRPLKNKLFGYSHLTGFINPI